MALPTKPTDQTDIEPALSLWAAVLANAVDDLLGRDTIEQKKALYWFRSDDDFVGSFVFVCTLLDVDTVRMRKKILRLTR